MSIKKFFFGAFLFIPFILWLSLFWRIFLYTYTFFDEIKPRQTIVVLGDGVEDGYPSSAFQARLGHAAELFKQGYAPLIILVGGTETNEMGVDIEVGTKYLREFEISDGSIMSFGYGQNMYNAIQLADVWAREQTEDGAGSSIFVTNDYHNYRVETTARDIGMVTHLSQVKSKSFISKYYHVLIESFAYIWYLIAEVS